MVVQILTVSTTKTGNQSLESGHQISQSEFENFTWRSSELSIKNFIGYSKRAILDRGQRLMVAVHLDSSCLTGVIQLTSWCIRGNKNCMLHGDMLRVHHWLPRRTHNTFSDGQIYRKRRQQWPDHSVSLPSSSFITITESLPIDAWAHLSPGRVMYEVVYCVSKHTLILFIVYWVDCGAASFWHSTHIRRSQSPNSQPRHARKATCFSWGPRVWRYDKIRPRSSSDDYRMVDEIVSYTSFTHNLVW